MATMAATSIKRATRWSSESIASKFTNFKTAITAPMTSEQLEAYALHVRIQEITQKLRIDDIVPADPHRRSPSPEPRYDSSGVRTNTRYQRHRERLEEERHSLIQTALDTIPNYRPPQGYKFSRTGRCLIKEKVYIPARDFPGVNFIGQLLGPRGRSLTAINERSGAIVSIRGKGSVKEGRSHGRLHGRGRAGIDADDHQNEPLHCLITADRRGKVDKAKELVQAVIETATTTPDHTNDRKRRQLRDLAMINGTFRDDESRDGYSGSRLLTGNSITCHICGNGGHTDHDCPTKKSMVPWRSAPREAGSELGKSDHLDNEYLLFELALEGVVSSR